MIVRMNGVDLLDDVSHFMDHFHPNTILQQIHDAPFGSGVDFIMISGITLVVSAIGNMLVPPESKWRSLSNIVVYLVVGLVTLIVYYDQMLTAYALTRTW